MAATATKATFVACARTATPFAAPRAAKAAAVGALAARHAAARQMTSASAESAYTSTSTALRQNAYENAAIPDADTAPSRSAPAARSSSQTTPIAAPANSASRICAARMGSEVRPTNRTTSKNARAIVR